MVIIKIIKFSDNSVHFVQCDIKQNWMNKFRELKTENFSVTHLTAS